MSAPLHQHLRGIALLGVFVLALIVASLAAPAAAPAADETTRLIGPNPPTVLALPAAPGAGSATEPTPPPRRPTPTARGYVGGPVTNGGSIRGTVRLDRPLTPWTVKRGRDPVACGVGPKASERALVGADGQTLANAVVFLRGIEQGKPWTGGFAAGPDDRTALLDQKGCSYHPHILVMREGTQVQLKNSDPAKHNIHAFYRSFASTQFNEMTTAHSFEPEAGDAYVEQAGTYIVKCDIHPWMSGYLHAFTHPYFAVTDRDGRFELSDVPPGTYTLVCWHEGMKEVPQMASGGISSYDHGPDFETTVSIEVAAGQPTVHDFVVPAP